MKHKIVYLLAVLLTIFSTYSFSQDYKPFLGSWQGVLKIQTIELHIVFNIKASNDTLKATLDSPDQAAKDIPCDSISMNGKSVFIRSSMIGAFYTGSMKSDSTIDGTFNQGSQSLPLFLTKTENTFEVNRPQEPKPPFPYRAEDVTYENKNAGITLAGTLTMPLTGASFPAVILITGSGKQNRDEALFGHKPFLVLADYLTKRGIAVLRVDDRGVAKSTGDFSTATTEDFVSDVLAGIGYLKTRKEINKKKIGLIGHSEGGMIAPMVAAKSNDVAFIVLMAGVGIETFRLLPLQDSLITLVDGKSSPSLVSREVMLGRKMFEVLKSNPDSTIADQKLTALIEEELTHFTKEELDSLNISSEVMKGEIRRVNNPWFRFFLSFDPQPILEKVQCPVLAINGEKDLQVTPKENLEGIEKALSKGGNKNFKTKMLPGLNHLFQTATTGSPSEYPKIEETLSPVALETMGEWLDGVLK